MYELLRLYLPKEAYLMQLYNKILYQILYGSLDRAWLAWESYYRFLNVWPSKGLLSPTFRPNVSAQVYWVDIPTASWLGTSNEPSLAPTNSARICWAAAPQTQQGFAEPNSTNSARMCWDAAPLTPQEWLSLTPTLICTQQGDSTTWSPTAQWLSVENAESSSPHWLRHSSMTHWVWLSTQASPQPYDSV